MNPKILIVDDELPQRIMLERAISSLGYKVTTLDSPLKVVDRLRTEYHDIVVTDMQMPEMTGLDLLANIHEADPTIAVIVATAHGTIETAVEAMKRGAEDYLQKPIELADLEITLKKVVEKRALVRENLKLKTEIESLRRDIGIKYHLASFLGSSPHAKEFQKQIQQASQNRDHVLLLGEVGTDKEDAARIIHYNSPWASNPLLVFDCAAIPADLHEVQLFGVETSSKNGLRIPGYSGLVEKSHMGTLIILNLHLLDRKSQSRLSNVARNQQTQRVGGSQNYSCDLRLITTSTPSEIRILDEGRWDFYDILLEKAITVPTLEDMRTDIPLIALATAKRIAQTLGKKIDSIDPILTESFSIYGFPGNHKELDYIIESAVRRCDGTVLTVQHLAAPIRRKSSP